MQIQITAEDVFAEYKQQLADLNHDLVLARLQLKKCLEVITQYEEAEAQRTREAAQRRQRATQKPAEPDTELPLPPPLPEAPTSLCGAMGNGVPV